MTDQQVSQLADWFIKRKHKASVHETTWDYLYSQGLLDVLEHDQRVAVSDALNDEVFKARLDVSSAQSPTFEPCSVCISSASSRSVAPCASFI